MLDTLLILGTSRVDGQSTEAVAAIGGKESFRLISLNEVAIGYYDYANTHEHDGFLPIAEEMTRARKLVFATPVYWYAMSAQMKTFFDRFTDLITLRKEMGRKLAGKQVFLLSWGHDKQLPEGFEVPFSRTADYFSMDYKGCFYYCTGGGVDVEERSRAAEAFRHSLMA